MGINSELYQQVILDHNKNPRNFKVLQDATHQCDGHNPLCGDKITVYLKISHNNIVNDASFQGSGCAISKASSSMMTKFVKGRTVDELNTVFEEFHSLVKGEKDFTGKKHHLGKLVLFEGVKNYPARVKCATLAWHAVKGAINKEVVISTEKKKSEIKLEYSDSSIPELDLSGVKCPINFVKAKVRLSKMNIGDRLKIILDDGDPIINVPRSLDMEGQQILEQSDLHNGHHLILVEKKV